MILKIKKLNKDAKLPEYAHNDDAGMDVFAVGGVNTPRGARVKVPTGIALEIPEGYVGLVWDKSGIAINYGLKTLGGVIDSGYRGEIVIGVVNLSDEDYEIKAGDKVAQILIQKVEQPQIQEVTELSDSHRGENGFGSTGR